LNARRLQSLPTLFGRNLHRKDEFELGKLMQERTRMICFQ
jgi:hypothetical protein